MYIMGENPAMSDPDADHAREALSQTGRAGGAGHLPDRNRLSGGRDPAGVVLRREDRQLHQHRSLRAAGSQGPEPARQSAPGPRDHHRYRPRTGSFLELRQRRVGSGGGVRRDAPYDAQHRRHHLGATAGRGQRHLSLREGRRSRGIGGIHRVLSDRHRQGRGSCRPISSRRTSDRTPIIPGCSSPAVSSNTGIPAA